MCKVSLTSRDILFCCCFGVHSSGTSGTLLLPNGTAHAGTFFPWARLVVHEESTSLLDRQSPVILHISVAHDSRTVIKLKIFVSRELV